MKIFYIILIIIGLSSATLFSQETFLYIYEDSLCEHYPLDIVEFCNVYIISIGVKVSNDYFRKCIVLNKLGQLLKEFYINPTTRIVKKNESELIFFNLENISHDNSTFNIRITTLTNKLDTVFSNTLHYTDSISFNELGIAKILINSNKEIIFSIEHYQSQWPWQSELTFFRVSENFEMLNYKHFGNEYNFHCFDIEQIPIDKGYLFTSWSYPSFINSLESKIVKLDSLFNLKQTFSFSFVNGSNTNDKSYIKFLTDTTFLLNVKRQSSTSIFNDKFELILSDTSFNILNTNLFGLSTKLHRVAEVDGLDFVFKNAIYFGGSKIWGNSFDQGPPYYYVISKVDSTLNKMWDRFFQFQNERHLHHIFATQDGGGIITGIESYNLSNYDNRVEIIKFDADGNYPYLGVDYLKISELRLSPNPASTEINIQKAVQLNDNTEIAFYDLSGKLVLNQKLTSQSTTINISHLPAGMYIYKCYTYKRVVESGKMIKKD